MNSFIIVFIIMKLSSCDSRCELPDSNAIGLNYYGNQYPNNGTNIRVRCDHGDYVTLGCVEGQFVSFSFGNLMFININTFCGGENCFTPKVVELNNTLRVSFDFDCYKHNFGGGQCQMHCIGYPQNKMEGTCTDGKLQDYTDFESCPEVSEKDFQSITFFYANQTVECIGKKCTIKCEVGYESSHGVTIGTGYTHNNETEYNKCLKNFCNFPQISNGYYSSWGCLYNQTMDDNARCEYLCDQGYVANTTNANNSNTVAHIPCRKGEIWEDGEKNFCTKTPSNPIDGEKTTNCGSEGNDKNDDEIKGKYKLGGENEDQVPKGPILSDDGEATTSEGKAGVKAGGNKTKWKIRIRFKKPPKPKKDASVFATKSIAFELLWLLVFIY